MNSSELPRTLGLQLACIWATVITTSVVVIFGFKKSITPVLMAKITLGIAAPLLAISSFSTYKVSQEPNRYSSKASCFIHFMRWNGEIRFSLLNMGLAATMISLSIFALKGGLSSRQFSLGLLGAFLSAACLYNLIPIITRPCATEVIFH